MGAALSNIVAGAQVSDVGSRMNTLEAKYQLLRKRNDQMLSMLAQKQSLSVLKEEAIAAGFVPRTTLVSLKEQRTLAQVPRE